MAVDMFIKIGDIKGEAQDTKNKDQIDVLAWSWGASNSGTTHMGGGGGAGKVNVQDLSFTKYLDKSTPNLLAACFKGTHIPTIDLAVRKAGGKQADYLTIKLSECLITSISTGGSGGEDRLTENVTINFAKVNLEYFLQEKDGSSKSAGKFGYNIAGNESEK